MSRSGRDYSVIVRRPSAGELTRRLPQAIVGMLVLGVATGSSVQAKLGVSPWDVFHQGIAEHTGLGFGAVVSIVGLVVMLAWIPLHQRFGVVSLINVAIIGPIAGLTIDHVATPSTVLGQVGLLALATLGIGVGAGLYIGAALGPGPRDGLMTALTKGGAPVWRVRLAVELSALLAGWLLGGTVGLGTVVLAFACAPITHVALDRFHMPVPPAAEILGE